jgi:Domain of unknown function (DUF4389)
MSTYYATSGGVSPAATDQQGLAPVLVAFAGPAPQSRLTVLVRIFLVIPHLIVLGVLGIAAYLVAIIGWFGALFTGRLPGFAADFLTGYLRWQLRVSAYAFLLTGEYPPFSLADAEDYPVRLAVQPGRLNRLAVLFRIVLLIPCGIVQLVVSYGAFTIFQLVSWLIVLVTGQLPEPVYQGFAAVLRYQVRTAGFAYMLTSAYPGGLFGDAEAPYGHPAREDTGMLRRLILSAAARKLVVLFIVLGVLIAAGGGIGGGLAAASGGGNVVNSPDAANQLALYSTPVTSAINNSAANVKKCKGDLTCVEAVDRKIAATFRTFGTQLATIKMPTAKARSANAALISSVAHTGGVYAKLGAAPSPTKYISLARSAGLQTALTQTNQAFANLGVALNL